MLNALMQKRSPYSRKPVGTFLAGLAFVVSLSGSAVALTFEPVQNLSENSVIATVGTSPDIAVDGSNVAVAWQDGQRIQSAGCVCNILFRRSTDGGVTWVPPLDQSAVNLSDDPTFSSFATPPRVVVSGSTVMVFWVHWYWGTFVYRRSTDGGATFGPIQTLGTEASAISPGRFQVVMSGSSVHVIWGNGDAAFPIGAVRYTRSTNGGATFESPVVLWAPTQPFYGAGYLNLAVSENLVAVAWTNSAGGQTLFRASTDGGATFGNTVDLSAPLTSPQYPEIAISGSSIHVVWNVYPVAGQADLLYRRSTDGGMTFESMQSLSGTGFAFAGKIRASGSNVYVAWPDIDGLRMRRSTDNGSSFETVRILSQIPGGIPEIAVKDSNVYVGWIGWVSSPAGEAPRDILFRRTTDGGVTWDPPLDQDPDNLSADDGDSNLPRIALGDSTVFVIWNANTVPGGIEFGYFDVFLRRAAVAPGVVVPANPVWTNTGLTLSPGDTVKISASGAWSYGAGLIGPDGDPTGCCHWDDFQHFDDGDKGRLIAFIGNDPYQGRWGDASFFPQYSGYISIGSAQTFTATVGGMLWLGMNDDAVSRVVGDNTGSFTATISVVPGEGGNPPVISVNPNLLDFGTVIAGSFKDLDLTVQNAGGDTLTGTASAISPFSVIAGSPFSLAAGQTQTIRVRFSPTSGVPFMSNVMVASNGGDASVSVRGEGNNRPSVSALGQFKEDGKTAIPEGGKTGQSTVVFKAQVSDPDGDQVRLELELRQTNETFIGVPTPETISHFAASGSQVPIYRAGLVAGSYRWFARALDARGAASNWVEFGQAVNTDFVVAGAPPPASATPIRLVLSFDPSANLLLIYSKPPLISNVERIVTDLQIINLRETWLFVRRQGNLVASDEKIPYVFLLGPHAQKTFTNVEFARDQFIAFAASKAGAIGVDQFVPLLTVAIDLTARGLFGLQVPVDAFDTTPNLLPLATGLTEKLAEKLAKLAGEFLAGRVQYLPVAMLQFSGGLDYSDPGVRQLIEEIFKSTTTVEEWVKVLSESLEGLIQIVQLPDHYVLFKTLAQGTITAGQEGYVALAAK